MTKRSEFRAACAAEKRLSKAEFEHKWRLSKEEKRVALAPWVALGICLVALALSIAYMRSGHV